jgi:hypothetical protein
LNQHTFWLNSTNNKPQSTQLIGLVASYSKNKRVTGGRSSHENW